MNVEELKLILDALQGVTNGAVNITVLYLLLNSIVPLLKYTIVGFVIYKVVQMMVNSTDKLKRLE